MEIKAKVALSLPNQFYKVVLKYDTFEKATYDSYLIASLIHNTNNENDALEYIDDITGKGSLNSHFKKLYGEISKLTPAQIDGILNDSLYPITVIDRKHHFKYYKMFDATRMDGTVYQHNLSNDIKKLKDLIMPKGSDVKFLSIDFEEEEGTVKQNVYDAIFTENEIKVDLDGGNYLPISKTDFDEVYSNDLVDIYRYRGTIKNQISSGNWNVLNNAVLDTLAKLKQYYIDDDGNYCELLSNCVKKTEVINVFSLYFYKETKYDYNIKNAKICEEAVNYLIESKNINEFKTKNLVYLLAAVNDKTAQKVIQYILGRKDSKELAELGLKLIKQGLEKGWESETLQSIKRIVSKGEIKYLYRIDPSIGYDLEDILMIDDIELSNEDLNRKNEYISHRNNIIKEMNLMVGEIMNSGIREKMKSLKTKDSVYKTLNDFIKEYSAHNRNDYESMSLENLTKIYNKIKGIYSGAFSNIKKRLAIKQEIA